MSLLVEQSLNGIQLSAMLFLLSAGLTLVFGIMGVINLAHGSLYMVGAYAAAWVARGHGLVPAGDPRRRSARPPLVGMALELVVLRRLYARDHVDQVLATFGLVHVLQPGDGAAVRPAAGVHGRCRPPCPARCWCPRAYPYPAFRLMIIAVVLVVAVLLWLFIGHTRAGMLVRAGATSRDMVRAMGVPIRGLYTLVFGLGAGLAGLAGLLAGPHPIPCRWGWGSRS